MGVPFSELMLSAKSMLVDAIVFAPSAACSHARPVCSPKGSPSSSSVTTFPCALSKQSGRACQNTRYVVAVRSSPPATALSIRVARDGMVDLFQPSHLQWTLSGCTGSDVLAGMGWVESHSHHLPSPSINTGLALSTWTIRTPSVSAIKPGV